VWFWYTSFVLNPVKAAVLTVPAVVLGLAVVGSPVPAVAMPQQQPAARPPAGATYLLTSAIPMTSSSGRHLSVQVFVQRLTWKRHHPSTSVQVLVHKAHEGQNWSFHLASSHFVFHRHTGRGHLVAESKALGHFGRINLRISSTGSVITSTCPNSPDTDRDTAVKVAGTFSFDTDSGKAGTLGKLGSRTRTTTFAGRSQLDTEFGAPGTGCFDRARQLCGPQVHGNSPSVDVVVSAGWVMRHGSRHGSIQGQRLTRLHSPAHSMRFDFVSRPAPVPQLRVTGDKAVMTIRSGGRPGLKGSATLASTSRFGSQTRSCQSGGSLAVTSWRASYTNGHRPLTLTCDLGGPITVKDAKHGGFIERDVPEPAPAG
jgi:hypothetical protein